MLTVALVVALQVGLTVDLPPGAVLRLGDTRFRAGGELRHLQFSADGRTLHGWVAATNGKLGPVAWDTAGGAPVPPLDNPAPPNLPGNAIPAVRLNGNRVLTAGPGQAARVWDADTRREVAQLHGHGSPITAAAASADGTRLATGSADGVVRVWHADTFSPFPGPRGHTRPVRSVRFSADGMRALTTGDDQTARVWDLTTGREVRAFATDAQLDLNAAGTAVIVQAGGTVAVRDVLTGLEVVPATHVQPAPRLSDQLAQTGLARGVSPTGRMVANARADGPIELAESATGEVRRRFTGHRGAARVLGFTPDGSRLLTAGDDHTVLVWDVRLQALPLPDAIKRETSAAKLWATMATGKADAAYLAMARLAAEPPAAVKMARMRLKPARWSDEETAATRLKDTRAIELLEALSTPEARAFLKELAGGEESAWLTKEAKRAVDSR
jgi:WD40 repeat protein